MPIVKLYADGGVIKKNPSPWGGTWAYCGVDENDARVIEVYGFISNIAQINSVIWIVDRRQGLADDTPWIGQQPARPSSRPITNNHTEQIAITKALEAMPDGWSGTVYSDSHVALGRVFLNFKTENLPQNISDRSRAAVRRLGTVEHVLLQGHPTKKDLESGIGAKHALPVSIHNVWCDKACTKAADEFKSRLAVLANAEITEALA